MLILIYQLMDFWKLKGILNYGKSELMYNDYKINFEVQVVVLSVMFVDQVLNLYDVSQISVLVLVLIVDWQEYMLFKQDLVEVKLIVNGELFDIIGGMLCVVVGIEYCEELFYQVVDIGMIGLFFMFFVCDIDCSVKLVFGELYILLVGDDNVLFLVQYLDVLLLVCYDCYNDVGLFINLKVVVIWNLSEDVIVCGIWGILFYVLVLVDLVVLLQYELFLLFSLFCVLDSLFVLDFFKLSFLVGGVFEGIKFENVEIMFLGIDWYVIDELRVLLIYWSVKYEDCLDQNVGFFFGLLYYDEEVNQDYFILGLIFVDEVIVKFGDLLVVGFDSLEMMFVVFGVFYVVFD